MNERINELLVEADIKFDRDINEIEVCVMLPSDLEKFAELIVWECCQAVERKYKYSNGTPVSFWEMSQDVQDLLKEHFGVEE